MGNAFEIVPEIFRVKYLEQIFRNSLFRALAEVTNKSHNSFKSRQNQKQN